MARQFDADFQALAASEFLVELAIGLLCFGESGKTPDLFFHTEIIVETGRFPRTIHDPRTEWIDGRRGLRFDPERMTDRTREARQGTEIVS